MAWCPLGKILADSHFNQENKYSVSALAGTIGVFLEQNPQFMEYVESYKELEVYKLARSLSKEIFELSKQFPREEMYSLTDQVRRSSRSVGGQIAEAWGKEKVRASFC